MNKLHSIAPTLIISMIDWTARTLGIRICIHPSIISWMTDVIGMVVDPCSTFMVHVPRFDRHEVPIVVVSKEDRDCVSVISIAKAYHHRVL